MNLPIAPRFILCCSLFLPAVKAAEHVIVDYQPGRFAGHPANRGAWGWGNELLVGYKIATYMKHEDGHSRDSSQPMTNVAARSLDGGRTWSLEGAMELDRERVPCPGGINFEHPDFLMYAGRGYFQISYDRGRTWEGPYTLSVPGVDNLTNRTDYVVTGPHAATLFLSSAVEGVRAGSYQDRALAAHTQDGGKTWKFLGWMTGEPIEVRSVMSSTVKAGENHLVSVLRRRLDPSGGPRMDLNWVDAYGSTDGGRTWEHRSRVAHTDLGRRNGNPPALARLSDGRIVAAYGYRAYPYSIRAKVSADHGRTWSREIILREDGDNWDIGYPQMVVREDGKLVTLYYFSTATHPEQHIVATIWDVDAALKRSEGAGRGR
jgi:hypothetical protein